MPPGASFEVIPIANIPRDARSPSLEPHRPLILVVDDEHVIADTLTAVLCRSGFAAIPAYDASSALVLAAIIPPELLITDIAMPGMNGIQLAFAIVHSIPDCRILLFSGHASHIDLVEAGNAGYNFPLLAKPIHPAQMLLHVAESLRLPRRYPGPRISLPSNPRAAI